MMPRESTVRWIHAHPNLSNAEKRLALYLLDREDAGGAIRVMLDEVARDTHTKRANVSRLVRNLVLEGVLECRPLPHRSGHARREYRFRTPDREAMSA